MDSIEEVSMIFVGGGEVLEVVGLRVRATALNEFAERKSTRPCMLGILRAIVGTLWPERSNDGVATFLCFLKRLHDIGPVVVFLAPCCICPLRSLWANRHDGG